MKLAIYLLSCCIAATWQQNPQFWSSYRGHQYPYTPARPFAPQSYYPHYPINPYYSPYFYQPTYQPNYQQPQQQKKQSDQATEYWTRLVLAQRLAAMNKAQKQQTPDDSRFDSHHTVSNQGTSNGDDMTARFPANLFRQNPTYVDEPADYRTFFFPKAVLKAQVYATSTKYTISTSTITSTSVISCIQAASFFGGSSQSCRRRRDNKEILAQFEEEDADGSLIEPSPIHSVEPTVGVDQPSARSLSVESSLPQERDDDSSIFARLSYLLASQNELARNGLYGFTTTSTLTSYSISTTVTKRTVTLGSSLSCLPSGYSVC